jgi:hypothetical protein
VASTTARVPRRNFANNRRGSRKQSGAWRIMCTCSPACAPRIASRM